MIERPHRAIALVTALALVASLAVGQMPSDAADRVGDQWQEYQSRLDELASDQKETLARLFELSRRVQGHQTRAAELAVQAALLAEEESRLAAEAELAREARDLARTAAVAAVRVLQRLGPASYLDILFGASDLRDLLQRLSIALATARGAVTATRRVTERHQALTAAVEELGEQRRRVAEARDEQLGAAAELAESRDRLEHSLADLGDERSLYEDRLRELEQAWAEQTQPVVQELVAGFFQLLDEGPDLPGARFLITAGGYQFLVPIAALNEVMGRAPDLAGTSFAVVDGRVRLEVPQAGLSVEGELGMRAPTTLLFVIDRVWFLGFPVDDRSVSVLFPEREMAADLGPALTGFELRGVEVRGDDIALSLRAWR